MTDPRVEIEEQLKEQIEKINGIKSDLNNAIIEMHRMEGALFYLDSLKKKKQKKTLDPDSPDPLDSPNGDLRRTVQRPDKTRPDKAVPAPSRLHPAGSSRRHKP